MNQVFRARKYLPSQMGSLGKASYMIIKQTNFPNKYDENEDLTRMDSDRVFEQDYNHAQACVKKHTGSGELGLALWFENNTDKKILAFIIEFIKADKKVAWTGYRIMGTISQSGYAIWTLELFAKQPTSKTKVYSGLVAPNVEK
jgi:hypothetical protein